MTTPAIMARVKERLRLALSDPSFTVRVNTWLTAGDGRQFCAHAPEDIAELLKLLEQVLALNGKLVEKLETLKVAVNDKVNDPGATAFIAHALAENAAAMKELGEVK
jgi:hypothetical protein